MRIENMGSWCKVLVGLAISLFVLAEGSHHTHPEVRRANGVVTEDKKYWNDLGQKLLLDQLSVTRQPINKQAKNIIFFLGDGMSNPSVVGSRIYKGQKYLKNSGEETVLEFENFPFAALSKTYCVDAQVADSACSATAYLSGVKTNIDTIGLDANVVYKNCSTQNNKESHVDSVMKWAQDAGKGTGIVTTTRITHATPSGTYAHIASRDWESDADILKDQQSSEECDDIAEQLIKNDPGKNFKVILGGGRKKFLPNSILDGTSKGQRLDGVDLVELWKANKQSQGATHSYVSTRDQLLAVNADTNDYLFGLFNWEHLDYRLDVTNETDQPSLKEMTEAALNILTKETNGFVLLVEGGRIDQAHHDGRAKAAFEETVEFEKAISYALSVVDREETLIIVTADHAHTMTINGYPRRGNNIFGIADISNVDNLPWPTISYATGPGYRPPYANNTRFDIRTEDMEANDYKPIATAPDTSESHGGDDVTIYARGPQAHLFQGVYEQHYIAHVMGYAACIGPGMKFCDTSAASGVYLSGSVVLLALLKYTL